MNYFPLVLFCIFGPSPIKNKLHEWRSSEVIRFNQKKHWTTANLIWTTVKPQLIPQRHPRHPDGNRVHRHSYTGHDGAKRLISTGYDWFGPIPRRNHYIASREYNVLDRKLRGWRGPLKLDTREDLIRRNDSEYFQHKKGPMRKPSSWVDPEAQNFDYELWYKPYRGAWAWNDSALWMNRNDTPRNIPPDYMSAQRRQHGSIPGKWDTNWIVPHKEWWWGESMNAGHLLFDEFGRETIAPNDEGFYRKPEYDRLGRRRRKREVLRKFVNQAFNVCHYKPGENKFM